MATNPFREPTPAEAKEVVRQRRVQMQATKRFQRVQIAYRELMGDPRYAAIREELSASLGECLHLLLESARRCPTCAPMAVRVDALNEVVARPLHTQFEEAQRSRMEPPEESDG